MKMTMSTMPIHYESSLVDIINVHHQWYSFNLSFYSCHTIIVAGILRLSCTHLPNTYNIVSEIASAIELWWKEGRKDDWLIDWLSIMLYGIFIHFTSIDHYESVSFIFILSYSGRYKFDGIMFYVLVTQTRTNIVPFMICIRSCHSMNEFRLASFVMCWTWWQSCLSFSFSFILLISWLFGFIDIYFFAGLWEVKPHLLMSKMKKNGKESTFSTYFSSLPIPAPVFITITVWDPMRLCWLY